MKLLYGKGYKGGGMLSLTLGEHTFALSEYWGSFELFTTRNAADTFRVEHLIAGLFHYIRLSNRKG